MLLISGVIASADYPRVTSSFESIATFNGTGSSGSITFSSIPSTYASLHLRINYLDTTAGAGKKIFLQFNGDTGSNYAHHGLEANGTSVQAIGTASTTQIICSDNYGPGSDSIYPTCLIIDLQNYATTSQNKTVRSFYGCDQNGSGDIGLRSGLWLNTNAINSIKVYIQTTNFATTTSVALYGIKGA